MDLKKGVDEDDFYEAIASFKGASKRLEKIAESRTKVAYKILPIHQVVAATTQAVKEQYPDRILVACLELHTYSSLNFLKEYEELWNTQMWPLFFIPRCGKNKTIRRSKLRSDCTSF
jgi:UDP-N-acetylmuramate: L-alanyl-gamma-D-glutamyl-meso-diaminopimelate ligase